MLVNYKVFEEIGLFDPGFIMYGEEVDFCWRAQLAGFQMATSTKAHMWHKESLSAKRVLPQSRYLKIRNQIIFYRRYTFGLKLAIMFIFSTFRVSYLIIKDIINSQIKLIRPLILGWYAGWFIGLEQDFYTNEN
jgi:GT2 family glycosyltransferase